MKGRPSGPAGSAMPAKEAEAEKRMKAKEAESQANLERALRAQEAEITQAIEDAFAMLARRFAGAARKRSCLAAIASASACIAVCVRTECAFLEINHFPRASQT